MRKLIASLLVVLSLFVFFQRRALAVGDSTPAITSTEVRYELPYPGVLPDSPWYFFKIIRDGITLTVVRNEPERSFYEVFLADKKIAAAEKLLTKGKFPLAAVTAMKAEDLLRAAVSRDFDKKKHSDLIAKIAVAKTKHREILRKIMSKYSSRETDRAWDDNEFVNKRIMNVLILKQ